MYMRRPASTIASLSALGSGWRHHDAAEHQAMWVRGPPVIPSRCLVRTTSCCKSTGTGPERGGRRTTELGLHHHSPVCYRLECWKAMGLVGILQWGSTHASLPLPNFGGGAKAWRVLSLGLVSQARPPLRLQ